MKVSELQGAELDYWVAKAEGWSWINEIDVKTNSGLTWSDCGPIIEREKIDLIWIDTDIIPFEVNRPSYWRSSIWDGDIEMEGKTPLEAAMRCFVASKYGDNTPS